MPAESPNPLEPLAQLFRDLRSTPGGLSGREAARRLEAAGPNEPARRGGPRWPGELAGAIALAGAAVACNTADLRLSSSSGTDGGSRSPSGDPTEVAMLEMAVSRG